MCGKLTRLMVVVGTIAGIGFPALGNEDYDYTEPSGVSARKTPILDDLNNFGRNLFNSSGKEKSGKTSANTAGHRTESAPTATQSPPRAGSALGIPRTSATVQPQANREQGPFANPSYPRGEPRAATISSAGTPPGYRSSADRSTGVPARTTFADDGSETDLDKPQTGQDRGPRKVSPGYNPSYGASRSGPADRDSAILPSLSSQRSSDLPRTDTNEENAPRAIGVTNRPLHQRMSGFRQTETDGSGEPALQPAESAPRQADTTADPTIQRDSGMAGPTPARVLVTRPSVVEHAPAVVSAPQRSDASSEESSPRARMIQSLASPMARPTAAPSVPQNTMRSPAPASPATVGDHLLMVRKSPVISVETLGPSKITVGKEAVYQLHLVNSGEVSADGVVVHVQLPAWADLAGTECSVGTAQYDQVTETARPLAWRVGTLPAGGRERLTLRLIPRESRPFDLAVRWDYQPAAAQAQIEVQEAKLAMQMDGPREVFYGRKELFALRLMNTGTGDAENVLITLMPIGSSDNPPATHRMGTLKAGEERTIEIELTARQTGELLIQVKTQADHGVRAELAEKVLVRRAALQVDVQGPQVQFVNAAASYRIRVANPGNAPARQVRMLVSLPAGAKYLSGIDGARLDAGDSRVVWVIETLPAGTERVFDMRCALSAQGQNRFELTATAEDDLTAASAATTRVEAIADLRLEVKDPQGPIPVGEEAVYELKVRNRGSKTAENVEVLAFFSNGIEPVAVEGGPHRIQPGQVIFQPIPAVAPGAEVSFRVRAKAEAPGAHIFRAEVHCRQLAARLVSEETTHYYQDGPSSAPMMASPTRGEPAARTAEQYAPPSLTPGVPAQHPMLR